MQGLNLLQDLAILLLVAGAAGLLCKRIGLSVIVGYLAAGMIIGPHTPPFSLITDGERILTLSHIGLVFLMFGIGLNLSVSKFGRMGAGTLVATGLGAIGVLVLTQLLGAVAGWTSLQSTFVAAMLMVSSSAVIAKVVAEQKIMHERPAQTALAVTVLEDVVAVAMLTILTSQVVAGAGESGGLGRALGAMSAFVVVLIGAGLLLIPRLLRRLETRTSPEMQTVIVAGLLFALALVAAKAGYSIALGAFLFGAILAEIPQKRAFERAFRGLRDVFSSVFFVSIGLMINPQSLVGVWPTVLAITAFALVARPVACSLALIAAGMEPREAKRAGLLLTPLGEFSYIIVQLGVTAAVLPETFYPTAVGASILTIFALPLVCRQREKIVGFIERIEPRWITRTLAAYHDWLSQVRDRPATTPLWRLLRPRLGQIAIEALFVSGLLIYAESLLRAVAGLIPAVDHRTVAYGFWSALVILLLVPVVAMWRNASALALLTAETWGGGRLPSAAIENALKGIALVALVTWLYLLLPRSQFDWAGWLFLALGAAVVTFLFSRRLVYWHSEWQTSVREVLADRRADAGELRAEARAALDRNFGRWDVAVAEIALPAAAAAAGRTLAQLRLPADFGCAVLEVERNGRPLYAPAGDFELSAGDTLLVFGPAERMSEARRFLERVADLAPESATFGPAVLGACEVGEGPAVSLAALPADAAAVRVVGIERDGRRIMTPPPDECLLRGDRILLLGPVDNIRRFERWLARRRHAGPTSAVHSVAEHA
ncbi:MAG TPA: cation:proton antiporter [Opitutus sp.]|nr:cation:proton antiporter [Opitutus sp.]